MTEELQEREGRRVGDITDASGLTVRTMHYYEEIGARPFESQPGRAPALQRC